MLSNYNNYPTHLLTSGHLFPSSNDKLKVYSGEYNSTELLHIGDLAVNLLDNYPNNPGFPIDIALVELNDNAVDLIVDNGPVINKFIPAPSILNKMAQVFFPTTNDYSNYVKIEPHFVEQYSLNSDARGWFTVRKMIKTEISITNPGDSGTILFVNQNLGAGVCTGGALGLFEPLDRALQAISEIENTAYYIWR